MENRAEKNIEMRNRGDKEERQRNRDILELREERKGGKLVVGLMHADTAAIMAPACCPMGLAYVTICDMYRSLPDLFPTALDQTHRSWKHSEGIVA